MAKLPKYRQVEEYLKREIHEGRLTVGDQIMTEERLQELFPYSPMTINKALTNLSAAGYIERIPGKGSFVTTPPHKNKQIQSASSFSEDMRSIGLEPGSRLVSYELVRGDACPDVAQTMGLDANDLLHHFVRLRTGGGTPVAVSCTYLDAKTVPALDVSCLSASFYEYLASRGITPRIASQRFSADLPSEDQRKLLEVENTALLCIESRMCVDGGDEHVFEQTTTYYIGNMYSYLFEPERNRPSLARA